MTRRTFFFVSLASALLAVGLHLTALGQYSRGVRQRAGAITAVESERPALLERASGYTTRGRVMRAVGLTFAVASAGLLAVSARRREPAWRPLILALLFLYAWLQFLFV